MSEDLKELKFWLALNAAPGIGPIRFHQILKGFRSPEQVLGSTALEFAQKIPRFSAEQAAEVLKAMAAFDFERELELMEKLDARVILFKDDGYPRSLLPLPAPAPVLYVRGRLPEEGRPALAVVGTRTPTPYGLAQCRAMVHGLAKEGFSIVSGLAKGIDAQAHAQALADKAPTFGVLGSGLDQFYPSENRALAERMVAEGGGVCSQFSMGSSPDKRRFPMRNGVISGLSSGVLVIEGEEDSGSLITAEWALEQGREVFALPGPADSRFSRGPNRLIQQGARLVMDASDIISELPGRSYQGAVRQVELPLKPADPELTGEEAKIFQALSQGKLPLDALALKVDMPAWRLSATVTMLEIKGVVRQLPGTLIEAV